MTYTLCWMCYGRRRTEDFQSLKEAIFTATQIDWNDYGAGFFILCNGSRLLRPKRTRRAMRLMGGPLVKLYNERERALTAKLRAEFVSEHCNRN